MIDLKAKTCPNREQRALATNAYFGKASDLVRDLRAGETKQCDRKFQQASGCVLNFYLTTRVATIRDAVMIVHAPVGCSSTALLYREVYRRVPVSEGRPADFDLHWLTTGLDQNDVVYGAIDKLRYAIEEAERRYHPKAIFILASCTSGIIGEDIDGLVEEMRGEISPALIPVHCEGTRSRIIQTAYDAFWHGVLKYLVKKPTRKQHDLVNIASMLSYTWQDRQEITRSASRTPTNGSERSLATRAKRKRWKSSSPKNTRSAFQCWNGCGMNWPRLPPLGSKWKSWDRSDRAASSPSCPSSMNSE